MVGRFVDVCRRSGKSKVMVLILEERFECEVYVDGIRLEHVSEFKYLKRDLDESGIDEAEYSRKAANGRKLAGAIRPLVNARDLQRKFARILHETLLAPVFMYGSETVFWKEKERSRIRAVQMDNLRKLLGLGGWTEFRIHE